MRYRQENDAATISFKEGHDRKSQLSIICLVSIIPKSDPA
jgi:hypothetical protein